MKGWEISNFEKDYKLFKKRLLDGLTLLQIYQYLQWMLLSGHVTNMATFNDYIIKCLCYSKLI
jgi:hypothetical protein